MADEQHLFAAHEHALDAVERRTADEPPGTEEPEREAVSLAADGDG
jgi:hypothetical protein